MSRLPSGYKELAWIESTGTQYVDTVFKPTNNTRVVMDTIFLAQTAAVWLFGARTSNQVKTFNFLTFNNQYRSDYAGTTTGAEIAAVQTGRFTLDKDKNVTKINGVLGNEMTAVSFQCEYALFLFCNNNGGTAAGFSKATLYSCRIYDDGALVRDFIPCRSPGGAIGLYDAVTAAFFGNAGTGEFIAGPEPGKLPVGYNRLHWIESTGTQWVDSNYLLRSQKLQIVCDFRYTADHSSSSIFGSETANAGSKYSICPWGPNPAFYVGSSKDLLPLSTTVNTDYLLDVTADNRTLTVSLNGTVSMASYTGTMNTTMSLAIFGNKISGTAGQLCSMRLRKFQMYDGEVLVRDFIPCMTAEGEVGLYDLAGAQFYGNSGTGVFLAGPRCVVLPAGYTHVEYIRSSGTQHIDTQFKPNQNTQVVMELDNRSTIADASLFGARIAWQDTAFFMWATGTGKSWQTDYGDLVATVTATSTGRHRIDKNKNITRIDGAVISTLATKTFQSEYPMFLFAGNQKGTALKNASMLLYSCQIYDDGTPVRDYIPCKNSAGAGGLYDLVNDKFYGNAGAGAFTVGPVVLPPIPEAPAGLAAAVDADRISLSWEAAEFAAGYKVYRNGTLIATIPGTSYTDTVPGSGTYVYTVAAYNSGGESEAAAVSVEITLGPPAPESFSVTVNGGSAALCWEPSEGAVGYRLYRDGALIAQLPSTALMFEDAPLYFGTYVYSLVAFSSDGDSAPATAIAAVTDFRLVTDRTAQDVAEKTWKGFYNASDMNRVGAAVAYIWERLTHYGIHPTVYPKTDWTRKDIPHVWQTEVYLQNVATLRDAFPAWYEMPDLPARMAPSSPGAGDGLDWQKANDIEAILAAVNNSITKQADAVIFCGEPFCGEL